jgi:hypothetical protein
LNVLARRTLRVVLFNHNGASLGGVVDVVAVGAETVHALLTLQELGWRSLSIHRRTFRTVKKVGVKCYLNVETKVDEFLVKQHVARLQLFLDQTQVNQFMALRTFNFPDLY